MSASLPRGSRGFALVTAAFGGLFASEGVSCVESIRNALLSHLLSSALSVLGNARSVTSSYRMTNKAGGRSPRESRAAPTSQSYYVGRVFAAFDQFDKAYRGALMVDEAMYAGMKRELAEDVCCGYQSLVEDILATVEPRG